MRDIGVGANTFRQQMTVCLLSLQGQERRQDSSVLLPLVSQRLVGRGSFLLENCILHPALSEHGCSAAFGCRTEISLSSFNLVLRTIASVHAGRSAADGPVESARCESRDAAIC